MFLVGIRASGRPCNPVSAPETAKKFTALQRRGLDKRARKAKNTGNSRESVLPPIPKGGASGSMSSKPSAPLKNAKPPCKHPRVQIVSREEDAEFVECLECREIFESSELKDMSIEESAEGEAQES
jgi:hypothetical protein